MMDRKEHLQQPICDQCLYRNLDPDICDKGGPHKKVQPKPLFPWDCPEGFVRESEYNKWPPEKKDRMAAECGEWWKSQKR